MTSGIRATSATSPDQRSPRRPSTLTRTPDRLPFDYSKASTAKTRPVDPDRLAELAALLNRPTGDLSDDELIQAVRLADEDRDAARERVGRLLAALYNRGGLSWPKLGQLTGIPYGTAHGLARPFIPRDDD